MTRQLSTASLAIQGAFVECMKNDTILMQMVTAVCDEPEEGQRVPYVQYGDDTAAPYDTKTTFGEDSTITLHVWAPGPGKTAAKRIMEQVLQAVTKEPLVIPGFTFDGLQREFLEFMEDGKVYHGICRFRVYTKQL